MKKFSEADTKQYFDVLSKHEEMLKNITNVNHIDVGYRYVNGKRLDTLAIRLHVDKKMPESDMKREDISPKSLDGLPIDIIEGKIVLENARDARFDPIVGGINIGNDRFPTIGTLGAVVYDKSGDRGPLGITCHHVLMLDNEVGAAEYYDKIMQPNDENSESIISTIEYVKKNYADRELDYCIFEIPVVDKVNYTYSRAFSRNIYELPHKFGLQGIKIAPRIGDNVIKSGRTTGVTKGCIDGISQNGVLTIKKRNSQDPKLSAHGDSGSIWLMDDTSNLAVGLHYAGDAGIVAYANSMKKIAEKANIEVSFPSKVTTSTVSPQLNGNISMFARGENEYLYTSAMYNSEEASLWTIWSPFEAFLRIGKTLASTDMPDGRVQVWMTAPGESRIASFCQKENNSNTYLHMSIEELPFSVLDLVPYKVTEGPISLMAISTDNEIFCSAQMSVQDNAKWSKFKKCTITTRNNTGKFYNVETAIMLYDHERIITFDTKYSLEVVRPVDKKNFVWQSEMQINFPSSIHNSKPLKSMKAAVLPDRRTQLFIVNNIGEIWTTWEENSPSPHFIAFEKFKFTGIIHHIALSRLPDKKLQLWATDSNGKMWTCWKKNTEARSGWCGWVPF